MNGKKPWYVWVPGGCILLLCLPPLLTVGFGALIVVGGKLAGTRYIPARELAYDISPDGKRAIFSGPGPLCVLDLRTKKITPLKLAGPPGPSSVAYPAFSPEGNVVAFAAASDLWLASLDGKTVRQLTHDDVYSEFAPRFSPEGDRLVFARPKNNPLSPTGVFWIESDVWTIRRDGTDLRQLTHGKYRDITGAQFAPDGRLVLFAAQVPTNDLGGSRQALFEVDAEGTQPPREIFGGTADEPGGCYVGDPALSPDGKQLVVLSDHTQPFRYDFCLLRRDGSGFRPLGLVPPGEEGTDTFRQPRFSPEGKQIFYLWHDSLWQMTRDGKNAHQIVQLREGIR